MARVQKYECETRYEVLEAFAESYGESPPAKPDEVPAWWKAFEKNYLELVEASKDGVIRLTLRTQTRPYEDHPDGEEDDDPDADGPESGGAAESEPE